VDRFTRTTARLLHGSCDCVLRGQRVRAQAVQAARGSVEAAAQSTGFTTYELDMLLAKVRAATARTLQPPGSAERAVPQYCRGAAAGGPRAS